MTQTVLITVSSAPYGSERTLSALRLATSLTLHDHAPTVQIFLISDAVVTALSDQQTADGHPLGEMIALLSESDVTIKVCKTCVAARGLTEAKWVRGVQIGTMSELAEWTLLADKVVSF